MSEYDIADSPIRLPDGISSGSHANPEDGLCVMECVARVAGEPHTDHPQCAGPLCTEVAIGLNDGMPDDATRTRLLGPLVWKLAGSRSTDEVELRRAYVLLDYTVRVFAPIAFDRLGETAAAARLRALPQIRDKTTVPDLSNDLARDLALDLSSEVMQIWEIGTQMLAEMIDVTP